MRGVRGSRSHRSPDVVGEGSVLVEHESSPEDRAKAREAEAIVNKSPYETLQEWRRRLAERIPTSKIVDTIADLLDCKDRRVRLRALAMHSKLMGMLDDSVTVNVNANKQLRVEIGGTLRGKQSLRAEAVAVPRDADSPGATEHKPKSLPATSEDAGNTPQDDAESPENEG